MSPSDHSENYPPNVVPLHPAPWPDSAREQSEGRLAASTARQRALGYRPPPRKPFLKRVKWGRTLAWTVYFGIYSGIVYYFVA